MHSLNPMEMPLAGANLIEASAGTGKTYTITALYLRLLLGINEQGHCVPPLSIEQILVVTFTEAATAEIKDRIRKRITSLRDRILGEETTDEIVEAIYRQISDKKIAYNMLDVAAKSMEEAAIYTIHGFCQRMLKQHAFESGMAFDLNFVMDSSELIDLAIKEFWRSFIYPQTENQVKKILSYFASPEALLKALRPLLNKPSQLITPQYSLEQLTTLEEEYSKQLTSFKLDILASDFLETLANSDLNKRKPPGNPNYQQEFAAFCESESEKFELANGKGFEIFGQRTLKDSTNYKKNATLITHSMASRIDELALQYQTLSQGFPIAICISAIEFVGQFVKREKQLNNLITPDDLLTELHHALLTSPEMCLAKQIEMQYPVALIDEFQDTDPIQFGIFSIIYQHTFASAAQSVQGEDACLVMIGDPKQAIYGFRGADIFTYIDAKKRVEATNKYTLATNFRSSEGVVAAVNTLFSGNPNSFIFNRDIPFIEVAAKGKSPQQGLTLNGENPAAVEFITLDDLQEPLTKQQGHQQLAEQCAAAISNLLAQGARGEALIAQTPVAAKDICILVRDRIEANTIKKALADHKLSAVFLSRESVFKTELAQHLYGLLKLLEESYNEAAFRGVLASPLFGLNYYQIYELGKNAEQWQGYVERLMELKNVWHKHTIMTLIERLITDNKLVALWQQLGLPVERWLTDLRHLGEELQQKQIELQGHRRLLHWFLEAITGNDIEGSQLRLESDQALIQIVTMHGSKGLEYPIVYMPFACGFRNASDCTYQQDGKRVIDLAPSEEAIENAEKERLSEDLRLLYVALTRAVHKLTLGVYNVKDGNKKATALGKTALGFLLNTEGHFEQGADWHKKIETLCNQNTFFALANIALGANEPQPLPQQPCVLMAKPFNTQIEYNWRVTSFSGITQHTSEPQHNLHAFDENHLLDWQITTQNNALNEFTFPKGAKPGSCLHGVFEEIDFSSPYQPSNSKYKPLNEVVKNKLAYYSIDEQWQPVVELWVQQSLAAPLTPNQFSLSEINMEHIVVEMEFMLPLKALNSSVINQVLLEVSGPAFSKISAEQIHGMLKGFVDLIFLHENQYFVLDYKSNHLGDNGDDYQAENMDSVMSSHHYHLQYLLYTVALNRLLKKRIANYNYERDFGGVYYLFLRGMPSGQGIFFTKPSLKHIEKLDSALFEEVNPCY